MVYFKYLKRLNLPERIKYQLDKLRVIIFLEMIFKLCYLSFTFVSDQINFELLFILKYI